MGRSNRKKIDTKHFSRDGPKSAQKKNKKKKSKSKNKQKSVKNPKKQAKGGGKSEKVKQKEKEERMGNRRMTRKEDTVKKEEKISKRRETRKLDGAKKEEKINNRKQSRKGGREGTDSESRLDRQDKRRSLRQGLQEVKLSKGETKTKNKKNMKTLLKNMMLESSQRSEKKSRHQDGKSKNDYGLSLLGRDKRNKKKEKDTRKEKRERVRKVYICFFIFI